MDSIPGKDASLAMLRDFMAILLDADMDINDALNRSFDLALDLAPYVNLTETTSTPREADIKMRAATLLREARAERS